MLYAIIKHRSQGFALVLVLLVSVVLLLLGSTIGRMTSTESRIASNTRQLSRTFQGAEAVSMLTARMLELAANEVFFKNACSLFNTSSPSVSQVCEDGEVVFENMSDESETGIQNWRVRMRPTHPVGGDASMEGDLKSKPPIAYIITGSAIGTEETIQSRVEMSYLVQSRK